ncbi:MAG: hypothetical protein ACMV1B_09220 [Prevotella sp.]
MGCSAQDQIAGYKAVHKKLTELNPKVDPVRRQHAINNYWLNLENNIMTPREKEVYKALVTQTDGVASINHSDTKQTNVPLVFVKEIDNDYVIYLENGQNYTFEKGKVKSKPTKAGRTVVLPSMELTKYRLEADKLMQSLKDSVNKPLKPIEYEPAKTRAEIQKENAEEAARMLSSTNAELQEEIKKARDAKVFISMHPRELVYKESLKKKKIANKVKNDTLSLFMKMPEVAPIVTNKGIDSYYDGINAVINHVLPTTVRYDELLAFSKVTIEELLGDESVKIIAGETKPNNLVLITTGKVSDSDVDVFTEKWYLERTKEGRRIAKIQDEDIKYDTLLNSKEFKIFKDKNQAEVAARLLNAIKDVNGAHTLTHEMIHIGSSAFMKANPEHPATKKVLALYKEALDSKDYIKEVTGQTYWVNSVDEFLAEALSNPVLIEQFNNMSTKYGTNRLSTLFKELVDTLLGMLGFTKNDSVYQHVMDGFTAMLEYQFNDKIIADSKKDTMGSDKDANIGQSVNDVEEMGFDVDLGQNLVDIFVDWYQNDMDTGVIASDKRGIFDAYVMTAEEFAESGTKLTEFEKLQKHVIDTYMETMTDLDTGHMSIDMFTNDNEQTAGSINLKTRELKVRWNKASRLTSTSEVLLHEVNHSMSHHVFKDNVQLRRLAEDLRNTALDAGIDYKVFLDGIDKPTANEIEIAKMKYEHTFDKTANVEEFYAYATTNERVYNAIKNLEIKTPLIKDMELEVGKKQPFRIVLNKLIKAVNEIWRMMSGRGVRGGQIIADMVTTIARLDAEMQQTKVRDSMQDETLSAYAAGKMSELDEKVKPVIDKVTAWSDKLQNTGVSKLGKQIAKIPMLNELMETGIAQYLWRTVTQDTTKDGVADMYMVFRHSKQVVEKHTADIRNGVKMYATELYKDVDERTKNSVTKLLLEADGAQFEVDELQELLNDDNAIDAEIQSTIQDIKSSMVSGKLDKETLSQIDGLAEYMVKGTASKVDQQMNAYNIAHGVHIPEYDSKKPRMPVELVDKLVSLKALQMTDDVHKTNIKQLLEQDNGKDIIEKTRNMYRGYIDSMREDATIDGYDPVPKGYTKPANGLLRYELVPEDQIAAQESVLMKLVESKPYMRLDGQDYYLMTGKVKSVGFTEGAIGLISHTTEGIPVSALMRRQNDMMHKKKGRLTDLELRKRTDKIIESIAKGETRGLEMLEGKTLVPVYNHAKEIVDYRVQLNKLEQEIHLPDRETELEDVLSSTFSRSVKTTLTASENKNVVDTIIKNSAQGVLENPDDYVLVEEYTEEDRLNGVKRERRHDRWDALPDHTKDYIFKRTRHKGILIHKDFVELMTGEKDMTIGNFAAFGFEMKQHPVARARLMALESYIVELLGYLKQEMIVLNGSVLVGNQVSNAMVAMNHGINPIKYVKKFKERWQQLNDYNEKVQMLTQLEVEQKAGGKVDNKIAQLKKQLEGNIWDELVKDGQYTALVEDINVDAKMNGQLATMLNEQLGKSDFGKMIRNVRDALHIDRSGSFYATMLKTVHYGDAITRQIVKEELEAKAIARDGELTDKNKRQILNYLDQLLVNYGYIPNRWWGYADRVLGLLFMKYYLNQPKAIISVIRGNPTKTLLMQGAQKVTGLDFADPFNTYTNSGMDGLVYRWMLDDLPEHTMEPNWMHLMPNLSSALIMR